MQFTSSSSSTLLLAASLATHASAALLPRASTFQISNFTVSGDWDSQLTTYALDITYSAPSGSASGSCLAHNGAHGEPASCQANYPGNIGAQVATSFNSTACDSDPAGTFSWSWTSTRGATEGAPPAFSLQVRYDDGHTAPLYGCREFQANYTCACDLEHKASPGCDTTLVAPESFELQASTAEECLYA